MTHPDSPDLEPTAAVASRPAWQLAFPAPLEAHYRRDHAAHAVTVFRAASLLVALLYLLLLAGVWRYMPPADLARWLGVYGWVGVLVFSVALLARFDALDPWFERYAGLGSFLAVLLSVAAAGMVQDPVAARAAVAAASYAVLVVYSLTGLRFATALAVAWLGGGAGLALAAVAGSVDGLLLLRTFAGASLLGMFIAYAAERRDRALFAEAERLRLAQAQSEASVAQLDDLARHDPLTGLANRRHFDEMLTQEWRRGARQHSPLAVLMIDVDHFKHYNDNLGHVSGDSCLRKVGAIIAGHTRRPGELAVRYGGEEFLLMFPDTERASACQLAARLLDSFHEARLPQAPGLARDCVTVSIGVAVVVPGIGMTEPADLIRAADAALYDAKRAGRDAWRCAPDPGAGPAVRSLRVSAR